MKKQKLALIFLSTLVMAASYASFPQNVRICLNVSDNTSPQFFTAVFVSSDIFDTGNFIRPLTNGESCVSHTYRKGPKNLKFELGIDSRHIRDFKDNFIYIDSSCLFMYNQEKAWVKSDYQSTGRANEFWHFNLTQAPPMNGYKYVYVLKCQHWAN